MTDDIADRAARLLHLRQQHLAKGDPVPLPITPASMFHLPGMPGGVPGYGRMDNPTWDAVEEMLTLLEAAPSLLFPSGMGAISAVMMACLNAGDRLLLPSDGYYTPRVLADRFLKNYGIEIEERPTASFAAGGFEGFAMVFIETPSNPGLDLVDIAQVSAEVRAAGGISVVDNTTMTPLGQRPLDLGADVVVASDTKAPGGHSDVLAGHVSSRSEAIIDAVRSWRTLSGGITGPFEAWMLHRSLETLEVRFDRMCTSAGIIAERLQGHLALTRLRYPGLPGDPSHNLAQVQMARSGFIIGLTLESEDKAEAFIDGCAMIQPATSFGGVHTSAERRARWGDAVPDGFVRLSVGCEPVEPLWAALKASLDRC
ncbi:cystathionine gamma-lyase [Anianabacter salinae]|uniref:cystathionine gamma-lyase n=1 Tax=Anianabacter salinae TaxID=2851023 RepID=UPI00225E09FC|nr:cystathionine gamma-lyase [Anianabacter salinae]MBV0913722.1 cystathionine gamma-lyase [Anianabacter salinae]